MFRFYRKFLSMIIPSVLLFLLAGNSIALWSAEISVTDKMVRTVKVQTPAKRAVLLTTYELIPALGIWDSIAASGKWANSNDLMSAYNYGLNRLPSVGSGADVNMETMMRINPDLVISWTFRPEQVNFMGSHGLTVISIYPDSLKELIAVIRMHGNLFGKEKRAEYCIMKMNEIFSLIKNRTQKVTQTLKRKILWIGSRPTGVSGRGGMTNDIIEMIGVINSAAEIGERNADVPLEKIIKWNPDVIFIWGNATYSSLDIKNNPQWRYINAVKNSRVYKAPEWSNWSPRMAPIALWMAMKVYTELTAI
jgi:iron complex transport system substrate-binding protein